jgi:hypothetical protein
MMTESSEEPIVFNGINGVTGAYSMPPLTPKQFSAGILGTPTDDPDTKGLISWFEQRQQGHFGIKEGSDPEKLEESGWGAVFPANTNPAVVDALRPLLDWRKAQAATQNEKFYKEYTGGIAGVRPNDSKSSWLARQGAENFGPVEPENVPYYLLLVGSPEEIDYKFQYLLDVQYAVGRIYFDTVEEYANYARSVVESEKQQLQLGRKISFFGMANPDDAATNLSSKNLIQPLTEYVDQWKLKGVTPWQAESVLKDEATKQRLADFLGGADTPALLLTASHGMSFPNGDARQFRHQGALLCQDWPGPRQHRGPIPEDLYFSADDLSSDANLWGTIAFFFACYGAGTPMYDEFAKQAFKDKREAIAPRPFISRLPQKMLSHPKGGALAVIGHVERAWGYSFVWGKGRSLTAFESSLDTLMKGAPIGYAFEVFNERYGEFATELTQTLDDAQWSKVDPVEVAGKWTANNDAKNYVVLGDPAVRVKVKAKRSTAKAARPSITLSAIPTDRVTAFTPPGADVPTPVVVVEVATAAPSSGGGLAEPGMAESFGIFDGLQQGAASVGSSMQQFVQKLSAFLSAAIDNAATLEVSSYTSRNMDQVQVQGGKVTGGQLRALTSLRIDGDVVQVVPVDENNDVDTALWAVHLEMVKQAQASRAELIRSAVSAVSSLVNIGGSK